jgi:small subunit ribosomal protein S6e
MALRIVIGLKNGKSLQKELDPAAAKPLWGKKVGDVLKGDLFGYPGYEFEATGGSDDCGFPMRKDVAGFARKKLLFVEGVGLKKTEEGIRHRRTVCGQVVSPKTTQLNIKVVKEGKDPIEIPVKAEKEEKA